MRARDAHLARTRGAVSAIALLGLASACASSNGPTPSRIEREPDGDFTITQEVRVGASVRSDFEAAVQLLERGENQGGIEKLLAVTEAAPQLASAHINLGIAYRRQEDWAHAEASVERALEASPRHPVALNELGIVLRRQGRFDEARASYERALEVAPDFHYARRNLAILCDLFLGDLGCAIDNYQRYAQDFPEDETLAIWIADLRSRAASQSTGAAGER
jgi:tetratricopeptide (TPR) repeat protein